MKRTILDFQYSEDTDELAKLAKALSHPARIIILKHLSQLNSCYTGDLVDILPLAQATVSQHIKELKNAGLIDGVVNPPKVKYCINQKKWKQAQKLFNTIFEQDFKKFKCC
ncbi:MAG: metalloregulator ArsR/SmtB family transcription factor [Bacteroidota bacterium]